MLENIFAKNIKKYRLMKGYSQETLSEISGLHRSYIASIETGGRNISLKNIEKLAIALGVPPENLLKDDTNG